MAESKFPPRDGSQQRRLPRNSGSEIQYLLGAEEELLQSISGRAPLPEVLHKICNALNSEISNMISFISLSDEDAADLAAIARSATLFGLHKFCSAGIVDGNDEGLGSLEMYCTVPRRPFLGEVRLIERATCLAAIAIARHDQEGPGGGCSDSRITLVRRQAVFESIVEHDAQE